MASVCQNTSKHNPGHEIVPPGPVTPRDTSNVAELVSGRVLQVYSSGETGRVAPLARRLSFSFFLSFSLCRVIRVTLFFYEIRKVRLQCARAPVLARFVMIQLEAHVATSTKLTSLSAFNMIRFVTTASARVVSANDRSVDQSCTNCVYNDVDISYDVVGEI